MENGTTVNWELSVPSYFQFWEIRPHILQQGGGDTAVDMTLDNVKTCRELWGCIPDLPVHGGHLPMWDPGWWRQSGGPWDHDMKTLLGIPLTLFFFPSLSQKEKKIKPRRTIFMTYVFWIFVLVIRVGKDLAWVPWEIDKPRKPVPLLLNLQCQCPRMGVQLPREGGAAAASSDHAFPLRAEVRPCRRALPSGACACVSHRQHTVYLAVISFLCIDMGSYGKSEWVQDNQCKKEMVKCVSSIVDGEHI